MNSLQIGLIIGFVLSLSLNGLFFWYLRKTTGRLLFISENLNDLISIIGVYRKHLKALYEMEMFYGDEVLDTLVEFSKFSSEGILESEIEKLKIFKLYDDKPLTTEDFFDVVSTNYEFSELGLAVALAEKNIIEFPIGKTTIMMKTFPQLL